MSLKRRLACSLLFTGFFAITCADDPWESTDDPVEAAIDRCDYDVCDIASADCIAAISDTLSCARGVEGHVPPVRAITAEQLIADWQDANPEMVDDRALRAVYRGLALVGLAPADYDPVAALSDLAATIPAYYDQGVIVIVDNGFGGKPIDNYLGMVHEMAHAHRDADGTLVRLNENFARTGDRSLGTRGIAEGEASLYALLADAALNGFAADEIDWQSTFGAWQADSLRQYHEHEHANMMGPRLLPYPFGTEFAYDALQADAAIELDRAFATPPESALSLMLGHAAWRSRAGASINSDAQLDRHALPILAPDYELLGIGHEGVWALLAMLQKTAGHEGREHDWINELENVSADVLSIFYNRGNDEVVVVWRVMSRDNHPPLLDRLLTTPGTAWFSGVSAGAQPTQRAAYAIDGDLVLIASTGLDATTLFDVESAWQGLTPPTRYRAIPRLPQPPPWTNLRGRAFARRDLRSAGD